MVSSMGATSMPTFANTIRSYLMFWPIFRMPGSSSTGFRAAITASLSSWSGRPPSSPRPSPSLPVWPTGT